MGNVTLVFDAKTAKAVQGFVRIENKEKALEERTKRLAQTSKQGAQKSARANKGWSNSLTSVIGGYVSVAAVIGGATRALAALHAERKRGAQAGRDTFSPIAQLAQLAGGSKAEMNRMMAQARKSTGAGMTLEQGAALQFSLESMGLAQHRQMFANLQGITQDPGLIAGGVATLQNALGRQETGGARAVLGKLLAASATSKTTLEEFAPSASVAAKQVSMIGGSDEEFLSALAHISKATKSSDVAATQIRAFATSTIKQGIGGIGLLGRAETLAAEGLSDQQLIKRLGRKEAVSGYKALLDQRAAIRATAAELHRVDAATGGAGDLVTATQQVFGSVPGLRATRATTAAEESYRLAEMDKFGVEQLRRDEAIARSKKWHIDSGEQAWQRHTAAFEMWVMDKLGVRGETMEKITGVPAPIPVIVIDDKSRGERANRNAGTE